MEFVEPIRDKKKIAQIKNLLIGTNRYRDLLLFVVGINTALRISDLLTLRIGDFVDEQGYIREQFSIREEKRDKRNRVAINQSIRDVLDTYRATYPGVARDPDHFVFFTTHQADHNYTKPITRERAWT